MGWCGREEVYEEKSGTGNEGWRRETEDWGYAGGYKRENIEILSFENFLGVY